MRFYLLLAFGLFCFYSCQECTCPTVWAVNYTEARWQRIRVGMDTNEVRNILGDPLEQDTAFKLDSENRVIRDSFQTYWQYSRDALDREPFPCECWQLRSIYFDSLWLVNRTVQSIIYD